MAGVGELSVLQAIATFHLSRPEPRPDSAAFMAAPALLGLGTDLGLFFLDRIGAGLINPVDPVGLPSIDLILSAVHEHALTVRRDAFRGRGG